AGERRVGDERHGGGDLAELLAEVIARDEDVRRQLGIAHEPRVARDDHPALEPRARDQPPSMQVRAVCDVVPEDPEPAGEPPEHRVHRKVDGCHGTVESSPVASVCNGFVSSARTAANGSGAPRTAPTMREIASPTSASDGARRSNVPRSVSYASMPSRRALL